MKKIISLILTLTLLLTISAQQVFADVQSAISLSETAKTTSAEYIDNDLLTPLEASTLPAGDLGILPAKSAVLMEVSTGRVLFEQNPNERLAPASITKIMSLLLVMEALDEGRISLEDTVTASEYACSMGGSQIWLEPGETMSVHELLKATAVASANDAAVALAELVSGSESTFVARMNERAAELGMKDTAFVNASGLDADGHLTSAYDIALASCELLKHEKIKEYSTIWIDSLRNGESELVNTNKLVRYYKGATGLKTGTTSIAGHCLSASAKREGMEIVAVVMGCESSKDRFNSARQLLDWGFANWKKVAVSADEALLTPVPVAGGTADTVNIKTGGELSLLLEKGDSGEIVQNVVLPEMMDAPIYENQLLGEIVLTIGDKEVGRIQLCAKENVEKMNVFSALSRLLFSLFAL